MKKVITEMYCDLCGKNYNECNNNRQGYGKDSGLVDIKFDHHIYVTQDTFRDENHGAIDISPIHMDLCSECFCRLIYALKNPQEILSKILPEYPTNYYDETKYKEVSLQEYDELERNKIVFSHKSYPYKCPNCQKEYYSDDILVERYCTKMEDGIFKYYTIFKCDKCGHKALATFY